MPKHPPSSASPIRWASIGLMVGDVSCAPDGKGAAGEAAGPDGSSA